MRKVNLNKDFSERNGKYTVSYNNYSDISIYTVSSEYYNVNYKEDLKVSVAISTEDGVVSDLDIRVEVINVERISKRRELIAFEVKQSVAKHIEQLKSRHNNVLDIDFIKDVVSFILNYNVCNRYEVVVEDEIEDTDATETTETVENTEKVDVIKKEESIMSFNKSFEVNIGGLLKSYNCSTEEVETAFGYTDVVYKLEAKSTVIVDGEYAIIKAYVELYDGVVTHVHIGRDNNHLQLESFLDSMNDDVSRKVNMIVDDIKYEVSSYVGAKDINFAYSILAMVLNINSFDTNTYLINDATYNLVDVA